MGRQVAALWRVVPFRVAHAGSSQLVPRDHPSEDMDAGMETGERVEGLEGVASLMDAVMRAGGDELDYESLLAVSQSMQLSM